MRFDVLFSLQQRWQMQLSIAQRKLDDLGDAMLLALNEILCGGSNYRQLLPASPTVHQNRTVVIVLLPRQAYWLTMECVLNQFTVQYMVFYNTHLDKTFIKVQKLFTTFWTS